MFGWSCRCHSIVFVDVGWPWVRPNQPMANDQPKPTHDQPKPTQTNQDGIEEREWQSQWCFLHSETARLLLRKKPQATMRDCLHSERVTVQSPYRASLQNQYCKMTRMRRRRSTAALSQRSVSTACVEAMPAPRALTLPHARGPSPPTASCSSAPDPAQTKTPSAS